MGRPRLFSQKISKIPWPTLPPPQIKNVPSLRDFFETSDEHSRLLHCIWESCRGILQNAEGPTPNALFACGYVSFVKDCGTLHAPMDSSSTFYFEFASHLQWTKEREINIFCVVLFHCAHNAVFFFFSVRER